MVMRDKFEHFLLFDARMMSIIYIL
jgi:hypothetical protein